MSHEQLIITMLGLIIALIGLIYRADQGRYRRLEEKVDSVLKQREVCISQFVSRADVQREKEEIWDAIDKNRDALQHYGTDIATLKAIAGVK